MPARIFACKLLKPLIDGKYRTLTGAANTAAMGSWLGGVVSFYLGWQWPDVFGKVACLSSTFTYRDNLLDRVSSEPKRKLRIYLDSGWPGDNYEATRSMRDRLMWERIPTWLRGLLPGVSRGQARRECMGCTQSDSVSVPFRKTATVLNVESI